MNDHDLQRLWQTERKQESLKLENEAMRAKVADLEQKFAALAEAFALLEKRMESHHHEWTTPDDCGCCSTTHETSTAKPAP
jgi:uncharacterized protein YhaN